MLAGCYHIPAAVAMVASLSSRLLLKFPTMYTGFAKCKAVFEELDINQDGGLQLQELRLGCAKLGYM